MPRHPRHAFNAAPSAYHVGAPAFAVNNEHPEEVDVLIVGGGLTGLSTALELAAAGRKVLVCEARQIGDRASGRSGGQVWPGYEAAYGEQREELDGIHGAGFTKAAWQLVDESIKLIHQRRGSAVDGCDFSPGILMVSKTRAHSAFGPGEIEALHEDGFKWISYVPQKSLREQLMTTVYRDALLYQGEPGADYGHINPLKYTRHLATLAMQAGAHIAEHAPVTAIKPRRVGEGHIVSTAKGTVLAGHVVLATGADFLRPEGIEPTMVPRCFVPVQTLVLMTEPMTHEQAAQVMKTKACIHDCRDSAMTYGRMVPANDGSDRVRFTFGGADAVTQLQTRMAAQALEREMYETFPALGKMGIKVEGIWGGECDLSRNACPVLMQPRPDLTYAAGFSGHGMVLTTTFGTAIAGRILGTSEREFDILSRLAPEPYSANGVMARFEALCTLAPAAAREKLDECRDRMQTRLLHGAPQRG